MSRAPLLAALALALSSPSPESLEGEGRLWEAGAAYQEEGDLQGQMRIMCRLLEEALYAGHPFRSARLIEELEELGAEPGELGMWRARLAWICGLEGLARRQLEELSGPGWAGRRAAGLAHLYGLRPRRAVEELRSAYIEAENHMERYYAAVDLAYAMLSAGMERQALEAVDSLVSAMPAEGLPAVLRCICLQRCGRYAEAMMGLDSLAADSSLGTGPRSMARDLLEDLQ
jgi:hypothetical protein